MSIGIDYAMRSYPVTFVWSEADVIDAHGEVARAKVMVPKPRYGNVCAKQFVEGHEYPLVILDARSRASHNFYFACLAEGFNNLPENIAARWPTPEHLRAWLLIESGWCEEDEFTLDDEAEAKTAMTKIRKRQPYARIIRNGRKVIVQYAVSQSAAAMGKDKFEASKKDVLDLLEHLTNVPRGALAKNAGRAA